MAQNLSIMTQNQNTIMEMLHKLRSNTNISIPQICWTTMLTKMRVTKLIKTINKTSRLNITNNIFDKDNLDQDHNESQASIIDNKDDPYNDKRWILQYAKESKSKESDIVDSYSTLTLLPPQRNLNVTLSGDFECEKPYKRHFSR